MVAGTSRKVSEIPLVPVRRPKDAGPNTAKTLKHLLNLDES